MAIPAGLREALAEIMRRNQIGIPELARQAGVLPAQLAQFLQGSLPVRLLSYHVAGALS